MKLYYFKDPDGNFGDDLNPWLWPKLLPEALDGDERELFVGIGTLLNHRLPAEPVKHVFGSGYGYGEPPKLDGRFVFHAVRGPDTARVLGLDPRCAITDAAVLVRTVAIPRSAPVPGRIGFMPHCLSSRHFDWGPLCAEVGLRHISAEWDVDTVLREMTACELMVCEAMHGAIVADTLRIPWIAVTCYDHISAFKWKDWLATLKLGYAPAPVTSLFDAERFAPWRTRAKNGLKRTLGALGVQSPNWTPPPPARTGRAAYERAARDLLAASKQPPCLSADAVLDAHVERYQDLLHAWKASRRA